MPDQQANFLNTYKELIKQTTGVIVLEPGQFDAYGLRFPIDYLNAIGTLPIMFPLEIMAKYADVVTTKLVNDNDSNFTNSILYMGILPPEDTQNINATGIGNLAYVCLHHPLPRAREIAESILETIFSNECAGIEQQRGKIIV